MPDRAASLTTQLAAFTPADATERAFVERLRALLGDGEPAFSRDHYEPGHVTASAFVLDPAGTSLLLIHHAKLGIWVQPGGHVDPDDDDVLAAARREVHEEVGLAGLELAREGLFDVDIHPIPARGTAPRHEHFDVRFVFRAASLGFAASDEVKGARWVPIDELAAVTDASVQRAASKLRR